MNRLRQHDDCWLSFVSGEMCTVVILDRRCVTHPTCLHFPFVVRHKPFQFSEFVRVSFHNLILLTETLG
jgi:hypothetical protein